MKTKKGLSLKQRLFLKEYIKNGGNATAAAEEAGYRCNSKKSFGVLGSLILARLRGRLLDIMEARGIDDIRLTSVLEDGLNLSSKYPVRLKYLDIAHKLRGDYAPVKQEVTGKDGGPIKTESAVELDIAKRLIDDERANKLAHALLESLGVNPSGNGNEVEPGKVDASKTSDPP